MIRKPVHISLNRRILKPLKHTAKEILSGHPVYLPSSKKDQFSHILPLSLRWFCLLVASKKKVMNKYFLKDLCNAIQWKKDDFIGMVGL